MNVKSHVKQFWEALWIAPKWKTSWIFILVLLCSARLSLSEWHSRGTEKPNGVQKENMVPILASLFVLKELTPCVPLHRRFISSSSKLLLEFFLFGNNHLSVLFFLWSRNENNQFNFL